MKRSLIRLVFVSLTILGSAACQHNDDGASSAATPASGRIAHKMIFAHHQMHKHHFPPSAR
jgi:hypothetical protein